MAPEARTQVLRGDVVLVDRIVEGGSVVVADGRIQAVLEGDNAPAPTLDLERHLIAAGFIDMHTHGIAGADTMDASPLSLACMAARYAAHGVTSFLPTTVTQSEGATLAAIASVRAYMERTADADMLAQPADPDTPTAQLAATNVSSAQTPAAQTPAAQLLGLHLEGPWVNYDFRGAQNGAYVVPPDEAMLERLLARAGGVVRKVTLAPELPGAETLIRRLRGAGIYVSLGHSGASYEQALQAVEWGATHLTHCFNAMTGLHHRRPGMIAAALLTDALYAELIADGLHVHPAVMRLLVRVKGRERVAVITDSMAAAELSDGTFGLGGQEVYVRDGEARLADGTLAGSTLTFDQAVRNLVRRCDVPLVDALYMAAATPAAALGLERHKGRIDAGYDADLVILDAALRPAMVMIAGRLSAVS